MTKRWLIFSEGQCAGRFEPLDLVRPCYGIRDGAFTNAERWIALLKPAAVTFECRESLAPFVHSMFQSSTQRREADKPDEIWTIEGMIQPVADKLWLSLKFADFTWGSGASRVSKVSARPTSRPPAPQAMPLRAVDGPWNLIEHLESQLRFDVQLLGRLRRSAALRVHSPARGVYVTGSARQVWVGKHVTIHPHNVLNSESGPIFLDDGVTLEPFNRIDGPAYVGKGTSLLGGKFTSGTAIGPGCKIGGEWEAAIAQGFVNKAHAGFFGHGILGEWVNLGAMTTNSDLKNNYGTVRVNRGGAEAETGLIKVGSFIADHSKTGIGTLIPTGATWGVGVNYFGGDMAPKHLPSFVWGDGRTLVEHRIDKMLVTANLAMKRRAPLLRQLGRSEQLTEGDISILHSIFNGTAESRRSIIS